MCVRGVRGATTVDENSEVAIIAATEELLMAIIQENNIHEDDIASLIFTMTPDLNACFPTKVVRQNIGWHRVALIDMPAIAVPQDLAHCIRVLIHWNTEKSLDEIKPVYLREAKKLRPDLTQEN